MKAWRVEWSVPFSPTTDYLLPSESFGWAAFTTAEVAADFMTKIKKHGWADSHGFRNAVKVDGPLEAEVKDSDVLAAIPEWCFPKGSFAI